MIGQAYEQLPLFPEDFHASRSAVPGSAGARMMTVISGRRCSELFRNSGPLGLLAKMLLESSEWRSTRCFLIWKARATKQGRLYFRLVPSTPRTEGIDARLLPTPTASVADHGGPNQRDSSGRPGLQMAAMLWPTPTVNDGVNSSLPLSQIKRKSLVGQIVKMLYPTPTTGAGLCGGTGNYKQLKALEESGEISSEERRSMASGSGGQLNPEWVEALMGFPPGWTELEPDGRTEPGRPESPE